MRRRAVGWQGAWRYVVAVMLCSGWLLPALPMAAEPAFVDGAFRTFWVRTDLLPEQGVVKRTYIWGPPLMTAPDGPKLPRTPSRTATTKPGSARCNTSRKGAWSLPPRR